MSPNPPRKVEFEGLLQELYVFMIGPGSIKLTEPEEVWERTELPVPRDLRPQWRNDILLVACTWLGTALVNFRSFITV